MRLCFPGYEDGSCLEELTWQIADSLVTEARRPKGFPLERLISFDACPEEFALWWDGLNCEHGCSALCAVAMDAVADRLVASGALEAA
ncbi:hypothetical protein [Sphingomonas sp. R86520]|uniref:hypothetical protein n=1 Tax=Sphingomonas sp. R86520 TaxID=3093859 RepID=UPI0036D2A042